MDPAEFELYAANVLRQTVGLVEDLEVTPHAVLVSSDGSYDVDAAVRFRLGGMDFLVVVECKRHRHPIKRELVQVLHSKVQSVGAQKGVLFSTSPFQSGALTYAQQHGIGLVHVTDGGPNYLVRSALTQRPDLGGATPIAKFWRFDETGALNGTVLDDNPIGVRSLIEPPNSP